MVIPIVVGGFGKETRIGDQKKNQDHTVVVMPRTILPHRNRRCALSATDTWKSEEEKDARDVTCFMEENDISLREVARFDEHKRD